MRRKCPSCGAKSVLFFGASFISPFKKVRCQNCGIRLSPSMMMDALTFFTLAALMFLFLLLMLHYFNFIGLLISLIAWVVLEFIRSFFIPLKMQD